MKKRELQWYLNSLQSSLAALKGGLEECVKLLAPVEPGSTLVLSSLRSESVKGFVTRIGTKIVKGVSFVSVQPLALGPFCASRTWSLTMLNVGHSPKILDRTTQHR